MTATPLGTGELSIASSVIFILPSRPVKYSHERTMETSVFRPRLLSKGHQMVSRFVHSMADNRASDPHFGQSEPWSMPGLDYLRKKRRSDVFVGFGWCLHSLADPLDQLYCHTMEILLSKDL